MTHNLTVGAVEHVAVIEITRPPANYFDRQLIGEIVDAAAQFSAAGSRAIVLCSQGKHFCAGANFADSELGSGRIRSSELLYREAIRLFDVTIPIIAAVHGNAVGGGVGLACAADFRIATPATRFHANFSMLGLHHGFGLSVTLPALVGAQHAQDLLYTSRRIDGVRAAQIGLVDRVVAEDQLRPEAMRWAAEIAAAAPLAVQSIRETLRARMVRQVRAALERELIEQQKLWATQDSRNGIAASLARTQPVFSGE
ncbi:MAG: hypothetical protein QOC76_4006 [Mycobacterium sp.]|jgi:enoyl-CoA hydratase/carnithine racemase|nr:hypothetical protein [Mycobacterium sp.]